MITICEKCIFSETNSENKQIGCKLNRAKRFGISDINDNGFYVLKRFCTTYRPEDWLDELSVSESLDICSTVLQEVFPRVGFFIRLDTEKEDIESVKKTLLDIKDQTPKARYIVVITDKVEYNQNVHSFLLENFDYNVTEFHIVQLLRKPEFMPLVIDEAFKHAKNGWAYVCDAGESIDKDLMYKIHKRVNLDLKKLVVVEPYDENLNGLLFQTALFKFLNGNGVKLFNDETVSSESFLDKVKRAAVNSDPETMITWEKFNES